MTGSEIPAGFFMPGRRCYVKRTEKVLLIVFLVVSLICGKYLLDYWQDSYDNSQNYRDGYTGALKAPVRCFGNHLSEKRESLFQTR